MATRPEPTQSDHSLAARGRSFKGSKGPPRWWDTRITLADRPNGEALFGSGRKPYFRGFKPHRPNSGTLGFLWFILKQNVLSGAKRDPRSMECVLETDFGMVGVRFGLI